MAREPEHWTGPRVCAGECEMANDPSTCGPPHVAKPWCVANPWAPHNRLDGLARDRAALDADQKRLAGDFTRAVGRVVAGDWDYAVDPRDCTQLVRTYRPRRFVQPAVDRAAVDWPGLRPPKPPTVRRFQWWSDDAHFMLRLASATMTFMTLMFGVGCAIAGPPSPGAALVYGGGMTALVYGLCFATYRMLRSNT